MSTPEIRHDLFVYHDDDTFADQLERYLVAGVETGETVLVIVDAGKRQILRDALGSAAEQVSFLETCELYTRPEATLASLETRVRASTEAGAAGARTYGEVPVGETRAERDRYTAYESIINRAFANREMTLMCGYDARVVPDAVIRDAWRTHAVVFDGAWTLSDVYEEPEALVQSLTPAFEPLRGLRSLPVGGAPSLEERIAEELAVAEVPAGRAHDLLVAAREVLSNAALHGKGVRALRVGRVGERFVCEIEDSAGGFDDPLAGYLPPRPHSNARAGLWIARQLTSRLELHAAPDGLTVRLWV